eukprot:TRINITY_DN304_c0_g2_i3.p1 TRINITY_DN304_c0_g2~~TRINITY_DN304_c0_g2_i3.p1  ORF type:complete len:2290 (+),score=441.55 TRINITY_DN304_c0_g2_i3:212-6871(+)
MKEVVADVLRKLEYQQTDATDREVVRLLHQLEEDAGDKSQIVSLILQKLIPFDVSTAAGHEDGLSEITEDAIRKQLLYESQCLSKSLENGDYRATHHRLYQLYQIDDMSQSVGKGDFSDFLRKGQQKTRDHLDSLIAKTDINSQDHGSLSTFKSVMDVVDEAKGFLSPLLPDFDFDQMSRRLKEMENRAHRRVVSGSWDTMNNDLLFLVGVREVLLPSSPVLKNVTIELRRMFENECQAIKDLLPTPSNAKVIVEMLFVLRKHREAVPESLDIGSESVSDVVSHFMRLFSTTKEEILLDIPHQVDNLKNIIDSVSSLLLVPDMDIFFERVSLKQDLEQLKDAGSKTCQQLCDNLQKQFEETTLSEMVEQRELEEEIRVAGHLAEVVGENAARAFTKTKNFIASKLQQAKTEARDTVSRFVWGEEVVIPVGPFKLLQKAVWLNKYTDTDQDVLQQTEELILEDIKQAIEIIKRTDIFVEMEPKDLKKLFSLQVRIPSLRVLTEFFPKIEHSVEGAAMMIKTKTKELHEAIKEVTVTKTNREIQHMTAISKLQGLRKEYESKDPQSRELAAFGCSNFHDLQRAIELTRHKILEEDHRKSSLAGCAKRSGSSLASCSEPDDRTQEKLHRPRAKSEDTAAGSKHRDRLDFMIKLLDQGAQTPPAEATDLLKKHGYGTIADLDDDLTREKDDCRRLEQQVGELFDSEKVIKSCNLLQLQIVRKEWNLFRDSWARLRQFVEAYGDSIREQIDSCLKSMTDMECECDEKLRMAATISKSLNELERVRKLSENEGNVTIPAWLEVNHPDWDDKFASHRRTLNNAFQEDHGCRSLKYVRDTAFAFARCDKNNAADWSRLEQESDALMKQHYGPNRYMRLVNELKSSNLLSLIRQLEEAGIPTQNVRMMWSERIIDHIETVKCGARRVTPELEKVEEFLSEAQKLRSASEAEAYAGEGEQEILNDPVLFCSRLIEAPISRFLEALSQSIARSNIVTVMRKQHQLESVPELFDYFTNGAKDEVRTLSGRIRQLPEIIFQDFERRLKTGEQLHSWLTELRGSIVTLGLPAYSQLWDRISTMLLQHSKVLLSEAAKTGKFNDFDTLLTSVPQDLADCINRGRVSVEEDLLISKECEKKSLEKRISTLAGIREFLSCDIKKDYPLLRKKEIASAIESTIDILAEKVEKNEGDILDCARCMFSLVPRHPPSNDRINSMLQQVRHKFKEALKPIAEKSVRTLSPDEAARCLNSIINPIEVDRILRKDDWNWLPADDVRQAVDHITSLMDSLSADFHEAKQTVSTSFKGAAELLARVDEDHRLREVLAQALMNCEVQELRAAKRNVDKLKGKLSDRIHEERSKRLKELQQKAIDLRDPKKMTAKVKRDAIITSIRECIEYFDTCHNELRSVSIGGGFCSKSEVTKIFKDLAESMKTTSEQCLNVLSQEAITDVDCLSLSTLLHGIEVFQKVGLEEMLHSTVRGPFLHREINEVIKKTLDEGKKSECLEKTAAILIKLYSMQLIDSCKQQASIAIKEVFDAKKAVVFEFVNILIKDPNGVGQQLLSTYPEFEGAVHDLNFQDASYEPETILNKIPDGEAVGKLYQQTMETYENDIRTYSLSRKIDELVRATKCPAGQTSGWFRSLFGGSKIDWKQHVPEMLGHIFAAWALSQPLENGARAPMPNQVIAILCLLGIHKEKESLGGHIVEVLTGEGKSVVLAVAAMVLATLGREVCIVCYSECLNKRDQNAFKDLISAFGLEPKIQYSTFPNLVENYIGDLRGEASAILEGKKPPTAIDRMNKKVLLLDEIDTFLEPDIYKGVHSPSAGITIPDLISVARLIKNGWSVEDVLESEPYKKCLSSCPEYAHDFLEKNVRKMPRALEYLASPKYVVQDTPNGKRIGYHEFDGVNTNTRYGYRTLFAFLHEQDQCWKGSKDFREFERSEQRYSDLQINCGTFSYSKIVTEISDAILGVTGTLPRPGSKEADIMKEIGIHHTTRIPTMFVGRKFRFLPTEDTKVFQEYNFDRELCESIIAARKSISEEAEEKVRPVLVFFKTEEVLNKFLNSPSMQSLKEDVYQILTKSLSMEERDNIIKNATGPGKIVFAVAEYGRGTDFVCHVKVVNANGGPHIIQTYVSSHSDEIQFKGRTARFGKCGSYSLVLCEDELGQFDISYTELQNAREAGGSNLYDLISRKRDVYFEKDLQEGDHTEYHDVSVSFLKAVRSNDRNKVVEFVKKFN